MRTWPDALVDIGGLGGFDDDTEELARADRSRGVLSWEEPTIIGVRSKKAEVRAFIAPVATARHRRHLGAGEWLSSAQHALPRDDSEAGVPRSVLDAGVRMVELLIYRRYSI